MTYDEKINTLATVLKKVRYTGLQLVTKLDYYYKCNTNFHINKSLTNPIILTTYYSNDDIRVERVKEFYDSIQNSLMSNLLNVCVHEHVEHKFGEYYLISTDIFHKYYFFDTHSYFIHDLFILPIKTHPGYINESHTIVRSEIDSKCTNNVYSRTKYHSEKPIIGKFQFKLYDQNMKIIEIPKEIFT